MALAGALVGARLIALDTSTFIYLIEKHPVFFAAVEPIFQAVDTGAVQAATSVLTLLEVLRAGNLSQRLLALDSLALAPAGRERELAPICGRVRRSSSFTPRCRRPWS